MSKGGWPENSRDHLAISGVTGSCLHAWFLCLFILVFFVVVVVVFCEYWVLNSGPYACIASTIVTDSYLKL